MASDQEPEFYCFLCKRKTVMTRGGYNCMTCGKGFLSQIGSDEKQSSKFDKAVTTTSRLLPPPVARRTRKNQHDSFAEAAEIAEAAASSVSAATTLEPSSQPSTSRSVRRGGCNSLCYCYHCKGQHLITSFNTCSGCSSAFILKLNPGEVEPIAEEVSARSINMLQVQQQSSSQTSSNTNYEENNGSRYYCYRCNRTRSITLFGTCSSCSTVFIFKLQPGQLDPNTEIIASAQQPVLHSSSLPVQVEDQSANNEEPISGLVEIFECSAEPSASSGEQFQENGAYFCYSCKKEQQMTQYFTCKVCGSGHISKLDRWEDYPPMHPELRQESQPSSLESAVDPESPDEDSIGTKADMGR